jgi:predicted permease
MTDVFIRLSPIILTYLLGIVLRRTRAVRREDGALFLRLVFFAAIPALILKSLPSVEITPDVALLPLVAAIIVFGTYAAAYFLCRRAAPERPVFGVTLVGAMIMNTSFILPFTLLMYGEQGFATAVVFDIGNAFLVASVIFYIACRYGEGSGGPWSAVKRVALAPPLWAFTVGLFLNLTGIRVHPAVDSFLTLVGNLMVPLVMISLGIYFSPTLVRPRLLITVLLIRSVGGFLLALGLAALLGLEGMTRSVVLISGAAPIGFNTLVFASLAKLDVEFAASLLSVSIALGIVLLPILIMILQ